MKYIIITLLFFSVTGCSSGSLNGRWKVLDPFFNATYQIIQTRNGCSAQLLSLNDGTSKYTYKTGNTKLWEFREVLASSSSTIDGNTGATQTHAPSHQVKIITSDTIEVSTTEFNQNRTYTWVKLNSK